MTTARSRPTLRLAVASGGDLAVAIDAFLSQRDLVATTRAKYRQTLAVVEDGLGDAGGRRDRAALASRVAGDVEPYLATVRSFARYCRRTRILQGARIDGRLVVMDVPVDHDDRV